MGGSLSQRNKILKYMREYGSITAAEAIKYIHCYRLSGRIHELRHLDGYDILTHYVMTTNDYGERKRFARYELVQ